MRAFAHDADYDRLMQSKRWRKLRAWQLTRQPLCERCLAAGILTRAREVHHIQPVEGCGDSEEKARRCFDVGNLQSLCEACHDATHAEMKSHSPQSIAATAKAETEAMKRALFDGGGIF